MVSQDYQYFDNLGISVFYASCGVTVDYPGLKRIIGPTYVFRDTRNRNVTLCSGGLPPLLVACEWEHETRCKDFLK
jgi:hypothetical protein